MLPTYMTSIILREYYERDVKCIQEFFLKRFDYVSENDPPFFEDLDQDALLEK